MYKNKVSLALKVLLFTFYSCNQNAIDGSSRIQEKVKTDYIIVLGNGDTLQTGVPIKLKKDEVFIDNSKTSVVPLKAKPQVFIDDNTHIVKKPFSIKLSPIKEKLKALNNANTKLGRDTILFGKELNIKIDKPIKANAPFYKDNAKYDIQCFGQDQGLGSDYVFSMLEDSKGNLWFGHYFNGVSKFDGEQYTNFKGESDLLSSKNVWSILEDNEGNFWFSCTEGGLVRYDGETFTQYSKANGFLSNNVFGIIQDKHNNIWFATDKGVVKYNNNHFTYYNKEDGLSGNIVISLLEDSKGNIWMGTTTGMTVYSESKFIAYTFEDGLPPKNIISIFEDDDKNIWFGTYAGGVCKYDGDSLSVFTEKEGLINNSIKAIQQDANGDIWFGSNIGGLCKYNGKTFQHISIKEGLPSDRIRTLLIDSKQNLWAGTEGGGVFRFNINSFINSTPNPKSNEISEYGQVFSILQDTKSNLWFASNAGELVKYDGESYAIIGKEQGLDYHVIFKAIEDSNNNIWLGTWSGLIKFDGKQFVKFDRQSGLKHERAFDVFEDKNQNIWFLGYNAGISKFDGKKITNYTLSETPEQNSAFCIYEDKRGALWFGTESLGICKYNDVDDTFVFYTKKEGLTSNYAFEISEDNNQNIWVGTDNGMSRFDGKGFTNITKKDGLLDDAVSNITVDKNDNLWVTSQKGINCIVYNEQLVSKVSANRKVDHGKAFIVNYIKKDGLKSLDFYGGGYLDYDNNLWFATNKGLITLNLDTFSFSEETPSLRLNTIEVNENFIDYKALEDGDHIKTSEFLSKIKEGAQEVKAFNNYPEKLVLPHNLNHLNFKFSAIDWKAPHDIVYSFKIEALDKEWSTPSINNYADYRNIPAGDYTFKVKTIGKSGQWSNPLEYSFSILPPWWLSIWAKMAYILLGVVLVIASFKWYAFKAYKKQLVLEQIIADRTKIIKQQKEEVQSQKEELIMAYSSLEKERNKMELKALLNQINPHFIFNALNSIQQFIITNNVKESLNYFNKLGKLIRSSLEHSEMKYVSVFDEIHVIENYIDLENLRFADPIIAAFNTNQIDIYNTKIPPMFVQPLVENAIVHGLSKKAENKKIIIDLDEFPDYLLCSITDNGLGRKHKNKSENKNSGLIITQKRLNSVWDKPKTDITIKFEDLKNKELEPIGTKVIIKLPKNF